MYNYYGFINGRPIIRLNISLAGAFALVKEIGRGDIFRREDGPRAFPVWPLHRRKALNGN